MIENIDSVTDEVYRAESVNDIKSGDALFHFYDTDTVEFRIEQTVTGLADGSYNFSLYIHGGSASEQHMYIYAIVDDEVFATQEMSITKWQEWQHPTIENIPVTGGAITVGAYVSATGSGPWESWTTGCSIRRSELLGLMQPQPPQLRTSSLTIHISRAVGTA